jgi:hypothetical protein
VGSVTSIDPTQDLRTFLEFIYGNETGYAYAPTKNPNPEDPVFKQYFFFWPTGKDKLIEHIQTKSVTHEVYFGPALYNNTKDAEKENFKGTNVVWVEFDGNSPTAVSDIPEPNIKIRSSTTQHEHWYWRLDRFVDDISVLEDVTQRLAYHLNADLGCWNANRVLRPPSTRHHESGLTVTTFRWDPDPTSINLFNGLPAVPVKLLQEQDINYIPPPLEIIAKYDFSKRMEDFKFFTEPKIEQGHRSSALAKLGHICIELGMTNAETLSLLLNADSRWGKFSKRKDQKARLLGIINYCRSRHPVGQSDAPTDSDTEIVEPRLKVYTYEEFINTEINLEWVIEGLLHKKGLAMLSGPPDVGKSQVSIRFAEKLARGQDFLKWHIPRPMKTLMVSMEMPHEELHYLLDNMQLEKDPLLNENLLILPLGYSIRLGNKAAQAELAAVVEEFKPDGIIFDSFGVGIGDDLNSEKVILDALDFVHKTLRGGFGCFVWFIHHNRKAQIGNKKPNKLEDLFGSQYIGAALTTAIGLWPTSPGGQGPIEVSNLKLRMAKKFEPFHIKRMTNLDFEVYKGETIKEGKIILPSEGIEDRFDL